MVTLEDVPVALYNLFPMQLRESRSDTFISQRTYAQVTAQNPTNVLDTDRPLPPLPESIVSALPLDPESTSSRGTMSTECVSMAAPSISHDDAVAVEQSPTVDPASPPADDKGEQTEAADTDDPEKEDVRVSGSDQGNAKSTSSVTVAGETLPTAAAKESPASIRESLPETLASEVPPTTHGPSIAPGPEVVSSESPAAMSGATTGPSNVGVSRSGSHANMSRFSRAFDPIRSDILQCMIGGQMLKLAPRSMPAALNVLGRKVTGRLLGIVTLGNPGKLVAHERFIFLRPREMLICWTKLQAAGAYPLDKLEGAPNIFSMPIRSFEEVPLPSNRALFGGWSEVRALPHDRCIALRDPPHDAIHLCLPTVELHTRWVRVLKYLFDRAGPTGRPAISDLRLDRKAFFVAMSELQQEVPERSRPQTPLNGTKSDVVLSRSSTVVRPMSLIEPMAQSTPQSPSRPHVAAPSIVDPSMMPAPKTPPVEAACPASKQQAVNATAQSDQQPTQQVTEPIPQTAQPAQSAQSPPAPHNGAVNPANFGPPPPVPGSSFADDASTRPSTARVIAKAFDRHRRTVSTKLGLSGRRAREASPRRPTTVANAIDNATTSAWSPDKVKATDGPGGGGGGGKGSVNGASARAQTADANAEIASVTNPASRPPSASSKSPLRGRRRPVKSFVKRSSLKIGIPDFRLRKVPEPGPEPESAS